MANLKVTKNYCEILKQFKHTRQIETKRTGKVFIVCCFFIIRCKGVSTVKGYFTCCNHVFNKLFDQCDVKMKQFVYSLQIFKRLKYIKIHLFLEIVSMPGSSLIIIILLFFCFKYFTVAVMLEFDIVDSVIHKHKIS